MIEISLKPGDCTLPSIDKWNVIYFSTGSVCSPEWASHIVSSGMQFPFSKFTRVVLGIVGMFSLYFLVDYYHLLPFSGSGANQKRLLYEEYPEMPKVGIPLSL